MIIKHPNITVSVFEPIPDYAKKLSDRYANSDRVKVFPVALGGSNIKACFKQMDGSSSQLSELNSSSTDVKTVCVDKKDVSGILPQMPSPTGFYFMHMNCEGCEYEVVDSLFRSKSLSSFHLIQIATHHLSWVGDPVERYCRMQQQLFRTHRQLWAQPWAWERWILK
jgi:FkbM family methyltransferase